MVQPHFQTASISLETMIIVLLFISGINVVKEWL